LYIGYSTDVLLWRLLAVGLRVCLSVDAGRWSRVSFDRCRIAAFAIHDCPTQRWLNRTTLTTSADSVVETTLQHRQTILPCSSDVAFSRYWYRTLATQCSKCNARERRTPPPIYGWKRSPTSACYNARERHTITVRDPNL